MQSALSNDCCRKKSFLGILFAMTMVFAVLVLVSIQVRHASYPEIHTGAGESSVSLSRLSQIESRLSRIEAQLESRQSQAELQSELPKVESRRIKTGSPCSKEFGEFTSLDSTEAAGWHIKASNKEFHGRQIVVWSDGQNPATMWMQADSFGHLDMLLSNTHKADDENSNKVLLSINNERVVTIGRDEHEEVCVNLAPGDIVQITETYGQISVEAVSMTCSDAPRKEKENLPSSEPSEPKCTSGQHVTVPGYSCASPWMKGVVFESLNESMAVVKLDRLEVDETAQEHQQRATSDYVIRSLSDLYTTSPIDSSAQAHRCGSLEFRRHTKVGIIVVADGPFRGKYKKQIKSQKCFAAWRGYEFVFLGSKTYKKCSKYEDFFFKKHCLVSQYLAKKSSDYAALVLDADVVAAVLNRGIEKWLDIDADIQFYERVWSIEIAAGNYLVRNTPWARDFLMKWADFEFVRPTGFSSADNGAIHVAIMESLELADTDKCRKLYDGLAIEVSTVENLTLFWEFIACTRKAMGPPRRWRTSNGGSIVIWGKMHFLIMDGYHVADTASEYFGPVFHHGIKEPEFVDDWYYTNLDACTINGPLVQRSREEYSAYIASQTVDLPNSLGDWQHRGVFPVGPCNSTLSCPLLRNDAQPKPDRTCSACQNLE